MTFPLNFFQKNLFQIKYPGWIWKCISVPEGSIYAKIHVVYSVYDLSNSKAFFSKLDNVIAFKYPLDGGGGGGVSRGGGSLSMSSTTRMIMKVKE